MNSLHHFTNNDNSALKSGFISFNKDFLLIIILLLASSASFGLGRLSYKESVEREVMVGEFEADTMTASVYAAKQEKRGENPAQEGKIVASKNGSKYHRSDCPGAKQIAVKNLIYFNSIEEARLSGYTPAGNCKGLE